MAMAVQGLSEGPTPTDKQPNLDVPEAPRLRGFCI